MNQMYLVLGDWSDDGHGKYDKILIETNKTVKQIQKAYKASCKKTTISFNHNENFTGVERDWEEEGKYQIAVDYENCEISKETEEILRKFDCELLDEFVRYDDEIQLDSDSFVDLFMWFVGLSIDDLEWRLSSEKDMIPNVNGDKNLNVEFGYGLYH